LLFPGTGDNRLDKVFQILTAYIDTTLPTGLRQQALKETYHFVCECPLCSPPPTSPVDWREAMWCPKKCGGVCRVPTEGW
jgi:hypothetical protein